jgi:hypothetical protein
LFRFLRFAPRSAFLALYLLLSLPPPSFSPFLTYTPAFSHSVAS